MTPAIDFERLADCIAKAESNNDDFKIGEGGRRGRFQIQEQLWQQISFLPFLNAIDSTISKKVAVRHLEWLEKKLRDHQSLDKSRVYLIALGWHAGPQAVIHLFATPKQKEYAANVEKLYMEIA